MSTTPIPTSTLLSAKPGIALAQADMILIAISLTLLLWPL